MEYYSKCNVCGKITCYTDKDLKENNKQSIITGLAAISTIGNAVAGTKYDMYESSKFSDRASSKIVDYSKCPNCGSKDVVLVTKKFAIFSNKLKGNYSIDDLIKEAYSYLNKSDFENAFCFSTMVLNEDEKNYDAYLIRFLASYEVKSLEEIDKLNLDYSNSQHFNNLLSVANETQKSKLLSDSQKNKYNLIIINSAKLLEAKDNENIVKDLEYYISELNNYDNEKSKKLLENLDSKRKEIMYKLGCEYLEENNKEYITKALDIFDELNDYKDSKSKLKNCKELLATNKKQHNKNIIISTVCISVIVILIILSSIIINNKHNEEKYNEANSLVKQEKYDKAIKLYKELGNYKDSEKKKIDSQNKKIYLNAMNSYNEGWFEEANKEFNKIKNYKDSFELAKKAELYDHIENYCKYQEYFTQNIEEYELVDSDEKLNKLFPNNWFVGYLSLACSFKPEYNILNSDGTISKPKCNSCGNYLWRISDSYLYYNVYTNYSDLNKYEVRKIFDDTYLLYRTTAKNTKEAALIIVLENSDTANKINFKN